MAVPTAHGLTDWFKLAPPPRPLTGGDQWNVFLSYRSVDRAWTLTLYDVLTQHGYKAFIDQCELKAGDELATRLQEALQMSQAGVLVWSSATSDSSWVNREYQVLERQATDKEGFQFVPVRLDTAKLPVFASNRIFLDFSSYPDGPNGGELLRLGSYTVWRASHSAARQRSLLSIWMKLRSRITMLEQIELQFAHAIRPKQLHALALARRGTGDDLRQAQRILGALYQHGERDPETLGIYGRTWMDRYNKSKDALDLQQSRNLYKEAFDRAPDDYYTGINAASKSVLLGTPDDIALGGELAQRVQKIVGTQPTQGDYWKTATVGEVLLLMKNYAEAGRLYKVAVAMARTETGSHEST